MLVEMTRLRRLPWSPWPVADLKLEAGRATLPWRGADSDAPGAYVVEWTIETSLVWGRDVSPATSPEPRVLPRADHLLVRGRWTATGALDIGGSPGGGSPDVGGTGALDIGGSLVLVDLDTPPEPGTWIELRLDPAEVSVYPYDL